VESADRDRYSRQKHRRTDRSLTRAPPRPLARRPLPEPARSGWPRLPTGKGQRLARQPWKM